MLSNQDLQLGETKEPPGWASGVSLSPIGCGTPVSSDLPLVPWKTLGNALAFSESVSSSIEWAWGSQLPWRDY